MPDWDNLRVLLAVAREGSFVAAGRRLQVDHTTVARRIEALERDIGAPLLRRSPSGTTLTDTGEAMARTAERIESEVTAATSDVLARGASVSGMVRLATPEAFGTHLVAPNLHLLYELHPGLELELAPQPRSINLSKREADIAITLRAPPRGRLVARRLVDYRLGLYAARSYLDRAPPIRSAQDIAAHPLVGYIDDLLDIAELRFLDELPGGGRTVFRSSSVAAQYGAVVSGLGIGALHLFTVRDSDLVRVLADEVEIRRSYWLIFHADQKREPRIRAVIDFLDALIGRHRSQF